MCWSCMKIWRFGNVPQGLLSSWSNLKAIDKTSKLQKRRIDAWVRTHLAPSGFPMIWFHFNAPNEAPGDSVPLQTQVTLSFSPVIQVHTFWWRSFPSTRSTTPTSLAPILRFRWGEASCGVSRSCRHSTKTQQKNKWALENGPSASEIKSWHDSGTFGKAQLQKGDGRFTWRQFSKRENSQIAFHRWSPNVPKCQWAPNNSTRCHLTACHSTSVSGPI